MRSIPGRHETVLKPPPVSIAAVVLVLDTIMALLLETVWGDIVMDLEDSILSENLLKLTKAGFYQRQLIHRIRNNLAFTGCPRGDGTGGTCIFGLLDNKDYGKSTKRFIKSGGHERKETYEKGDVVACLTTSADDTIGSQFAIAIGPVTGEDCFYIGKVAEDFSHILNRLSQLPTDEHQRPLADVRMLTLNIVHDPYDDPPGFEEYTRPSTPTTKPSSEVVQSRLDAAELDFENMNDDEEEDEETKKKRALDFEEQIEQRDARSRAVVLEMVGDLPSAEATAPENVLFVCQLNPVTTDEDLQLIFSRFDEKCQVQVVRDRETGASLHYAFVTFTTEKQATRAYFKMNNVLIDDRRIKVDFSQSVSHLWDRYNQRMRKPKSGGRPRSENTRQPRNRPENGGGQARDKRKYDDRGKDWHRRDRDAREDKRRRDDRYRNDERHPDRDDYRRDDRQRREDDRYRGDDDRYGRDRGARYHRDDRYRDDGRERGSDWDRRDRRREPTDRDRFEKDRDRRGDAERCDASDDRRRRRDDDDSRERKQRKKHRRREDSSDSEDSSERRRRRRKRKKEKREKRHER